MLKGSRSKVTKDGRPASPQRDRDVRTDPSMALGPGQAGTGCSRRNEEPLVVAQGRGPWGHCGAGDGTSRRSGTKAGAPCPASCALGSRAAMGAGSGGEQGWARVGGQGSVPSCACPHAAVSKEASAALGMGSAWHVIAAVAQITAGAPEAPHSWAAGLGCTAQPHPLQLWAPTSTPGRLGSSRVGSIWGGPSHAATWITPSHAPPPQTPPSGPGVMGPGAGAPRTPLHPASPPGAGMATAAVTSPPAPRHLRSCARPQGRVPTRQPPGSPGRAGRGRDAAPRQQPAPCMQIPTQRCSLCGAMEGARSWGHPPRGGSQPGVPPALPMPGTAEGTARSCGDRTGQCARCQEHSTHTAATSSGLPMRSPLSLPTQPPPVPRSHQHQPTAPPGITTSPHWWHRDSSGTCSHPLAGASPQPPRPPAQ